MEQGAGRPVAHPVGGGLPRGGSKSSPCWWWGGAGLSRQFRPCPALTPPAAGGGAVLCLSRAPAVQLSPIPLPQAAGQTSEQPWFVCGNPPSAMSSTFPCPWLAGPCQPRLQGTGCANISPRARRGPTLGPGGFPGVRKRSLLGQFVKPPGFHRALPPAPEGQP